MLGGNPWKCDCKLAYIKHLQSGRRMVSIIFYVVLNSFRGEYANNQNTGYRFIVRGHDKLLLSQTTVGKSGWINLGEEAAELVKCDTGEKLLKDWKLFRYCNDPFMIQCLEIACAQGNKAILTEMGPTHKILS